MLRLLPSIMMPFSVFSSSNATDRVTLHKQNPFFDKALQKDTFAIRGVQYTRCEVIAVNKKVRAPTSPIWKSGEALLCAKDSKRYFYCWYCEVTSAVQQLPCVVHVVNIAKVRIRMNVIVIYLS
jgi:hypothetical protein